MAEMRVDANGFAEPDTWADAVDLVADQGQRVWVLDPDGRRLGCLVPVDEAEDIERQWDERITSFRSVMTGAPADTLRKVRDARTPDQHGEDRTS